MPQKLMKIQDADFGVLRNYDPSNKKEIDKHLDLLAELSS